MRKRNYSRLRGTCVAFSDTLSPCSSYDVVVKSLASNRASASAPVTFITLDEGNDGLWSLHYKSHYNRILRRNFYATTSGVRHYNNSIVICQIQTWGYNSGVVNTTMKDFHSSEQYKGRIVNTMTYFHDSGVRSFGL